MLPIVTLTQYLHSIYYINI